MKELSIFVDESGDFGTYNSKYAPQYILTIVFHDQEISIDEDIKRFDYEMANLGFFNHVVHTAPLIRKEEVYCNLMLDIPVRESQCSGQQRASVPEGNEPVCFCLITFYE